MEFMFFHWAQEVADLVSRTALGLLDISTVDGRSRILNADVGGTLVSLCASTNVLSNSK